MRPSTGSHRRRRNRPHLRRHDRFRARHRSATARPPTSTVGLMAREAKPDPADGAGIAFALIAAVGFGLAIAVSRFAYEGCTNGFTVASFRSIVPGDPGARRVLPDDRAKHAGDTARVAASHRPWCRHLRSLLRQRRRERELRGQEQRAPTDGVQGVVHTELRVRRVGHRAAVADIEDAASGSRFGFTPVTASTCTRAHSECGRPARGSRCRRQRDKNVLRTRAAHGGGAPWSLRSRMRGTRNTCSGAGGLRSAKRAWRRHRRGRRAVRPETDSQVSSSGTEISAKLDQRRRSPAAELPLDPGASSTERGSPWASR